MFALAVLVITADPAPELEPLRPVLRTMLLEQMPTPLAKASHDWGRQADVVVGFDVKRNGPLNWDTQARKAKKNDGHWFRGSLTAKNPGQTLSLGLYDARTPRPGTVTFEARVGGDADFQFEQQIWVAGVRGYSGETRGRFRVAVRLVVESTQRYEKKPGDLLPEAVVRVRVTEAELFYSDLVVEHTLGVGGGAAKKLGEAAHKLVTKFKPDLEKELLAKANAAVVKAADTKEVRVGLDTLLRKK